MAESQSGAFRKARDVFELLSFVAVVAGIIIGFTEHFANEAQGRRDLIENVYTALDNEYRDFLGRLLDNPRLGALYRGAQGSTLELSDHERLQLRILDELFVDLFERAYLEFNNPDNMTLIAETRRNQWGGWESDFDKRLADPQFRKFWVEVASGFDARFQGYVAARAARFH